MSPFKARNTVTTEVELEGGMVYRFNLHPLDRASDTALGRLELNTSYLEDVVASLVDSIPGGKVPGKDAPFNVVLRNPDHGDLRLAFWLSVATPEKVN